MLCTPFLARCWMGFHPHFWWQPYPLFKTIQTLCTFRCFLLNQKGASSHVDAYVLCCLAGLLLLVTYLILAILYFFEGAGKDHSLAVLEWLAAFSSHVFHTTPHRHQWSVNIFFQEFISNICICRNIYNIYYGHDLLKWWLQHLGSLRIPQLKFKIRDRKRWRGPCLPGTWKANQYFQWMELVISPPILSIGKWLATLETLSLQVENSTPLFGLVSFIMTLLVSRHRSKSIPEWHWWHRTSHHSGRNLSRKKPFKGGETSGIKGPVRGKKKIAGGPGAWAKEHVFNLLRDLTPFQWNGNAACVFFELDSQVLVLLIEVTNPQQLQLWYCWWKKFQTTTWDG